MLITLVLQSLMQLPFEWDTFSNQPYQLKDKAYKKAMRRKHMLSYLQTLLTSLIILPLALLFINKRRTKKIDTSTFFGMGVTLDFMPKEIPLMIEELGVQCISIRLPLWELDRIGDFECFSKKFPNLEICYIIMQDREHVEDLALAQKHLHLVFTVFSKYSNAFQIGTTINRAKWGFFGVNEYLRFYQVAYALKKEHYPSLKLYGPGVIDFEYHFTAHALFNLKRLRFDGLSALLYVDRRGAPENKQLGFDLMHKVHYLEALYTLSPKCKGDMIITETNWPLTNTAPFAPTSEKECVDEEHYASYMVRYYLLTLATQQIATVYWHQLIAPGYGLVDCREGVRKRSAYKAFKTMVDLLRGSEFLHFDASRGLFRVDMKQHKRRISVVWSLEKKALHFRKSCDIVMRDGQGLQDQHIVSDASPIYVYDMEIA